MWASRLQCADSSLHQSKGCQRKEKVEREDIMIRIAIRLDALAIIRLEAIRIRSPFIFAPARPAYLGDFGSEPGANHE